MAEYRLWMVLSLVLVVTTVGVGLAFGATQPAEVPQQERSIAFDPGESSVEIEDALDDAEGEVEVVLILKAPPIEEVVEADKPEVYLQDHAEAMSDPIELFAETIDDIEVEDRNWLTPSLTVTVDLDEISLSQLTTFEKVVAIESANTKVSSLETTQRPAPEPREDSETSSDYTYGLEQINAPDAWDTFGTQGEGVSIAVLDTGVDPDHPDIDVAKWRDFDDEPSADPMDYGEHGTHVIGTVVGGAESGQHIGVAPEAALYAGAVLTDCDDDGCSGTRSQVIDGMEWAVEEDADIISMSLGGDGYSTGYLQATQNAHAAGTTVIAATGNDGVNTATTPGNIYSLVSVGATEEDESVWYWSGGMEIDTFDAWGTDAPDDWPDTYIVPDVTAPGHQVYSALPGDSYGTKSGTSMATPHVAGVVALMQSATDQHLEADSMMEALTETAYHPEGDDADQDIHWGHGIVDAYAAVDAVLDTGGLDGTISDELTGHEIDGATVTVTDSDGNTHERVTDVDGGFAFDSLEVDTYTVAVERDGYEDAAETTVDLTGGEVTTKNVTLTGDGAFDILVYDEFFETAVLDADVTVTGEFGTYGVSEAEDGIYLLEGVPTVGEYDIEITAPGYQDTTGEWTLETAGETAELDASMIGDAELHISASDAVSAVSLEGVELTITRDDGTDSEVTLETDNAGEAALAVAGLDIEYAVQAELDGYEPTTETEIIGSGDTVVVQPTLSGDAAITVEMSGELFGETIEDGEVSAEGPNGVYPGEPLGDASYRIEDVPSIGEYEITSQAEGYVDLTTTEAVTTAGDAGPFTHELEGDATLEISVEDEDGDPIEGAALTLGYDDAYVANITDATPESGEVDIAVPGTSLVYVIDAEAEGYESTSVESDLVGPGEVVPVTVTMEATNGIPGFGMGVAIVALIAVAYGLARRRG